MNNLVGTNKFGIWGFEGWVVRERKEGRKEEKEDRTLFLPTFFFAWISFGIGKTV